LASLRFPGAAVDRLNIVDHSEPVWRFSDIIISAEMSAGGGTFHLPHASVHPNSD
jgi:hypothetical protein